ncbi:unnamed protein product [Lampetra planeri]
MRNSGQSASGSTEGSCKRRGESERRKCQTRSINLLPHRDGLQVHRTHPSSRGVKECLCFGSLEGSRIPL